MPDDTLDMFFKDKTVLVTGGAGSIGSAIVRALLEYDVRSVRVLDNNESALFYLVHDLSDRRIRTLVGDVRDYHRMDRAVRGADIVFHAAALKHVPLCEYNPFEAVKTNVLGTQNVLKAAIDHDVNKFILISTDKAVSPTSVMGATKLLAERVTVASNFWKGKSPTIAAAVRFGNVVGTRGSVVPLFLRQILNTGEITITDPAMTRYLMDVSLAVHLVLEASFLAKGGEVFVLKMKSVELGRLADMILKVASEQGLIANPTTVRRRVIGLRPGEKMHERLVSEEEIKRIRDLGDLLVILPEQYERLPNIGYVLERFYSKYPYLDSTQISYLSSETAPRFSDEELYSLISAAVIRALENGY